MIAARIRKLIYLPPARIRCSHLPVAGVTVIDKDRRAHNVCDDCFRRLSKQNARRSKRAARMQAGVTTA
jgi:hypothetical protein